jgi:penicillin G amidase
VNVLDAPVLQALQAYSADVNAGNNFGVPNKPHEFSIIGGETTPWTPADTLAYLKLISFNLPSNWDAELARLRMIRADGAAGVQALDPAAEALAAELARFQAIAPGAGGSNNWVISGERTSSGKPILANDPHLGPNIPAQWYFVHIRTPEWTAAGATFAGAPPIIIGHNDTSAWGVTAGLTDNTDTFIETLGADGRSVRNENGTLDPCEVVKEIIKVKGQDDIHEEIVITPRGPIITPLLPGLKEAISLRAVWLDALPLRGFFDAARAKTFHDFRRSFAQWPCLPLNMVYANTDNETGWQLVGQIPQRNQAYGALPQAADAPESGWQATHLPFEKMPFIHNPPAGFFATANEDPRWHFAEPEKAVPSDVGHDFLDRYRGDCIRDELSKNPGAWDVAACLALQTNQRSWPWELMKHEILQLPVLNNDVYEGIQILREWDGIVSAQSAPAAVYELFIIEICTRIAKCRLPQSWKLALGGAGESMMDRNLFCDRRVSHLLKLLETKPAGFFARPWPEELADALASVVQWLRRVKGPAAAWWAWGDVRPLHVNHMLLGKQKFIRNIFNLPPVPIGGDSNTIFQAGVSYRNPQTPSHNMPNLRVVFDCGNWSNSRVVLCGGQSGNPLSVNYSDLFDFWQRGEAVPLPWTAEEVLKTAVATLRLNPAK